MRSHLNSTGYLATIQDATAELVRRGFKRTLHRLERPCVRAFYENAEVFRDARELLTALVPASDALDGIISGYAAAKSELDDRYDHTALVRPVDFDLGEQSSLLLYSLIRLRQPDCVLETGVANGHSTYFILKALEANGIGELHSVEIDHDVGALLKEGDKDLWSLHVLESKDLRASFVDILEKLANVDLFLHDSDHSYRWQLFEYESVARHLSDNGLILSDDVDKSFAFLEFCQHREARPSVVIDRWKMLGIYPGLGSGR